MRIAFFFRFQHDFSANRNSSGLTFFRFPLGKPFFISVNEHIFSGHLMICRSFPRGLPMYSTRPGKLPHFGNWKDPACYVAGQSHYESPWLPVRKVVKFQFTSLGKIMPCRSVPTNWDFDFRNSRNELRLA